MTMDGVFAGVNLKNHERVVVGVGGGGGGGVWMDGGEGGGSTIYQIYIYNVS